MTATAVTSDTIDQILSIIELHGGWARFACRTSVLYLIDLEALGRAMLGMNMQAGVGQSDDCDADCSSYRWQGGFVTLAQGYRALRTFLDACVGCPTTARTLYQALEGYAGLLAAEIAGGACDG